MKQKLLKNRLELCLHGKKENRETWNSLKSLGIIKNEEDTCLIFSTRGRRYFGLSFLQLQLQWIMQIPTDDITVIINGTMKKCIIVFTCVSRL